MTTPVKRIILFASGSGTNAENIIRYFSEKSEVSVVAVLSNKHSALVLERAKNLGVSALSFNRPAFTATDCVLRILKGLEPDLIVLAGFLWKIPEEIIGAFPNKIINIHPALLPKYGGKGMYGQRVHQAIRDNKEKETGISIHYVNEKYDEGAIIFQASTEITEADTVDVIAQKVHKLEYLHFPQVIEKLLLDS